MSSIEIIIDSPTEEIYSPGSMYFVFGTPLTEHSMIPGLYGSWDPYNPHMTVSALSEDMEKSLYAESYAIVPHKFGKQNRVSFFWGRDKRIVRPDLPATGASKIKVLMDEIEQNIFDRKTDQLMINDYEIGQGLKQHSDASLSDKYVCTVSLGSPINMEFCKGDTVVPVLLVPGSIIVQTGEVLNDWTHGLPKTPEYLVYDKFGNVVSRYMRQHRMSMTYRLVPDECMVEHE